MKIVLERIGLNNWNVLVSEGENDIDRKEYGVEHIRTLYSGITLIDALERIELSIVKKVKVEQLNLFEVKNA